MRPAPKAGFGKALYDARKKLGMFQREAATVIGISESALSHYETGARVPNDVRIWMGFMKLFKWTFGEMEKHRKLAGGSNG